MGELSSLISSKSYEPVNGEPARKYDEGKRDRDRKHESQLDGFTHDRRPETQQDIADDIAIVEGDDAKETDAEVDGGDHVDGAVDHRQHSLQ